MINGHFQIIQSICYDERCLMLLDFYTLHQQFCFLVLNQLRINRKQ